MVGRFDRRTDRAELIGTSSGYEKIKGAYNGLAETDLLCSNTWQSKILTHAGTVISPEHWQVSISKYAKTRDANIWRTRYRFSKSKYKNGWRILFTPDILESKTLFFLVDSSRKDAKQRMFYPVILLLNSLISLHFTIIRGFNRDWHLV